MKGRRQTIFLTSLPGGFRKDASQLKNHCLTCYMCYDRNDWED